MSLMGAKKWEQMEKEQPLWQDFLGRLIKDTKERKRIANMVRVQPITLSRWASGMSKPREEHLRRLLRVLPPDSSQTLLAILQKDFPTHFLNIEHIAEISRQIPSAFYDHVLNVCATTSPSLYSQTIYDLILQQAIEHLDPDRRGMSISLVRCVAPLKGSKVRSLREVCGVGTPPWERDLRQHTIFLGAESLCGLSVMHSRLVVVHDRQASHELIPAHWVTHEQSAAAYPLLHQARVIGCLLLSGAHPCQLTETHLAVMQSYANLLALAFSPTDFFDLQDVELLPMPPYAIQAPYFEHFQQRVTQKLMQSAMTTHPITLHEAQEQVWQEIEAELLGWMK
jgi:hypothetical protein